MKHHLLLFSLCFVNLAMAQNFEQMFDKIMKRSTTIPPQEAALTAKKIERIAGYSNFLPTVDLVHSRAKTHKINSDQNRYEVQASWNLFNSGADLAQIKANNYDYMAQKNLVKQTKLEMEASALNILFSIIKINKNIEILKQFKEVRRSSLKTTRLRFNKGLSPKVEVDKASIDLEIADARLKDALIRKESISTELDILLGKDSTVNLSWPWLTKLEQKTKELSKAEFLPEDRPDFNQLKFDMLRAEQLEKRDFRRLFFRVDLTASYGYTEVVPDEKLYGFSSLLQVSLPLFEGFSAYSSYKSSEAIKTSNKYRFENIRRTTNAQWKYFKSQLNLAVQTVLRREKNLKLSRKLYDINFKRFRQGRSNVNDLLLDQTRLLDSETLTVEGWLAAHKRFYEYCHALGKSIKQCL